MMIGSETLFLAPIPKPCGAEDLLLCFFQDRVLLGADLTRDIFPAFSQVSPFLPASSQPLMLFKLDGHVVYGLDTELALSIPADMGLCYHSAGIFRQLASTQDELLLVTAYHLVCWYRRNRFCGGCATPFGHSTTERALVCPCCGQTVYPTISPAVSVAITHGEYLLMARNAHAAFPHFSLIAGYTEVGEALEETVRREVMEEVGLKVKNIRYVASQAWGFSQSEMIGFHAELDGSNQITLQESELSEARWFHRGEIQANRNPLSLSFEMIERFRRKEL